MGELLRGVGVGSGIAIGPAYRMGRRPDLPDGSAATDPRAESLAAADALAAVSADLAARSLQVRDPTAAAVLDALSMIAADPDLLEQVEELIRERTAAPHAVHRAFESFRHLLTEAGGYLAERAADLADVRDRVIAVLLGVPVPGIPDPGHPFVLVADDLSPADTATIDTDVVLALVTEKGGTTSHTAIVARSLGLPCVVSCTGVTTIDDGTVVAVDAEDGTVAVDPGPEERDAYRLRADDHRLDEPATGPGRTADGEAVALLHNIGSAADLAGRTDDGFEGVGLFRTEFLFLDRAVAPSFEEQRAAYTAVLEAAGGHKVVVRTLDAGADKPLPFVGLAAGPNPALGVRGLRIADRSPELLRTQLDALAAAERDVPGSQVWVMAPMVATATEAGAFAAAARGAGLRTVGVMIEIPAAALRAEQILAEVDFLSIGTNDLSQYTFAADRMEGALAHLLDPWQPALLDLIARCCAAGRSLGKPVGICGEAAAEPALAPVLAGLGVTSLSMTPRAVPAVRAKLARWTMAECRAAAAFALAAPDAASARRARHRV